MVRQERDAGIEWIGRDGRDPTRDPAIVFLHGIGSNAASFRDLLDLIPEGPRLIAWNAPGYGGSDRLTKDRPTDRDYADALARFLDALDCQRVIVLGHSLGTLMGSAFARAHPDRVQHLILAASACGYAVAPGAELPPKVAARITDLEALGPAEFARTRAPRLIFDPEANPALVARVEAGMAQVDPEGYAQAVRMLAGGDLEANLRGLTVPCDFILGAEDIVTPLEQTERAMRALATTGQTPRRIDIAGAGHAVYLQKPQDFAQALLRLIPSHADARMPSPTGGHHG